MNRKTSPSWLTTLTYPAIAVVLGLTVLGLSAVWSGFAGNLTVEMTPNGGRLEIKGR